MTDTMAVVNFTPPNRLIADPARPARVHLLGRMRMTAPWGDDLLPRKRKTRALVACLCLAEGERVSRSRLIGLLWDRAGEPQARTSLRHALSELNSGINGRIPDLINIDREWASFNVRGCWVDVFNAPHHTERLLDDLDGITAPFDHWLAAERTRLEDRLRTNFEADLDRLIRDDAPPQLRVDAARKLIEFEPTHERAVRTLMTSLSQLGHRSQAIREYERCREALRRLLDLAPSRETLAVFEALHVAAPRGQSFPLAPAGRNVPAQPMTPAAPAVAQLPAEPEQRPSIAVLPFRNLSNPADNRAGDGLVEDLIEFLSRVPNFFVISRLSTLAFRNQDRLPQEMAQMLGVRYVLSGSIRMSGDRMRLTAELTDTHLGAALWSSRIDETCTDPFDMQYRVAEAIVRRVAPYMHAAELKRTRLKQSGLLDAYDLFLRAQETMHNSSPAVFDTAEGLFDQVLARSPNYAAALAWRAYWHVLRVGQGWSPDPEDDARQAENFAQRAIECDSTEPMAFAVHGHVASYLRKDFNCAFQCFSTALELNPNAAQAWLWSAAARAWMGDGPRAVREINHAMALSPFDPLMYAYSMIAAIAHLVDGRGERAVEFARRSIRENPTYTSAHRLLVIALMITGRQFEGREAAAELLRLEPGLTVERFQQRYPGSASKHVEQFCAALAEAGVPLF